MKFIEVRDGFSIAIDEIQAIEKSGELFSLVHTSKDVYESTWPYKVLLEIISRS